MNYLMSNVLSDMDHVFHQCRESGKFPVSRRFAVDIAESDDGYRILADLPGFTVSDVEVRVEGNLLVIEAKAPQEADEKLNWTVRERLGGDRKRSFVLPDDVDKGSVEARMESGNLFVELKKRPESKPFNVKVQG